MRDTTQWVTELATAVRTEMMKPRADGTPAFEPGSCVAAVRMVLAVLEQSGIVGAVPVAATAIVTNAEAVRLLDLRKWLSDPGKEAITAQLHAGDETSEGGPWAVGVGGAADDSGVIRTSTRGELHHVVVGLRGEGLIVDPSIDQASRPVKDMAILGPLVITGVAEEWFDRPGSTTRYTRPDGVRFDYTKLAIDYFRDSPDWTRRGERGRSGRSGLSSALPKNYDRIVARVLAGDAQT